MTLQSKKSPDAHAPPFLCPDYLRAHTFVRHVEIHDSLDSTNNRAAELARETNINLPALIVARLQTAGRGRGTNRWWSAEGALTFSLLIDPAAHELRTVNWPQLSLATAVAVCDAMGAGSGEQGAVSERIPAALEGTLPAPSCSLPAAFSIKWPNDVLASGRKIAGILLESPGGAAPAKDRLIIGIGANVNNSWGNAPRDMAVHGVALCDLVAGRHDLQALLATLLKSIADCIDQLRRGDERLARSWQRLNWLAGQDVIVENQGQLVAGRCVEIAVDGAIVIDTPYGRQRHVSGSVRLAP
jgi:BirA family transcriptional regulator, biotin operon repressor / biotin---[acetyl-CoA-carboxylase] ligase